MSGNKITLTVTRVVDLCPGVTDYDLGRFPAGAYTIDVIQGGGFSGAPPPLLWTTSFIVPSRAIPPGGPGSNHYSDVNYTDLWWDPQRPGWGVMITHRPDDTLFAAWFDYGADGEPLWYTLLGKPSPGGSRFKGPVMKSHGRILASPPFVQSAGITIVGQGEFLFGADISQLPGNYAKGRMSVEINGVLHESPIERFAFD